MRYIAFLRGINLGKRRVSMEVLKGLFRKLGLQEVESFIASGNLLFTSKSRPSILETQIQKQLKENLGYEVETFVRSAREVKAVANSKILASFKEDPLTIHVAFMKDKLDPQTARNLTALTTDRDWFHVEQREFFWFTRGRMSDSEVWTLPEAKQLKLPSFTMRNFKSVRKLAARLSDG